MSDSNRTRDQTKRIHLGELHTDLSNASHTKNAVQVHVPISCEPFVCVVRDPILESWLPSRLLVLHPLCPTRRQFVAIQPRASKQPSVRLSSSFAQQQERLQSVPFGKKDQENNLQKHSKHQVSSSNR